MVSDVLNMPKECVLMNGMLELSCLFLKLDVQCRIYERFYACEI